MGERADNTFQICPVCYWEDDGVQLHDPTYAGGANSVSLNQARKNFLKMRVSEERFKEFVRSGQDNEKE